MAALHPILRALIVPSRALWLGGLMLAGALTEGLGLVLLVPLLHALEAGAAPQGLSARLASLGLPLALEALLACFVALVALRAGIVHARMVATQRFELELVDGLRRRAWHALLHCDWRLLVSLRRSDSASLLLGEVERVGFGMQQAISALAIVVTLGAILIAALAISPLVTMGAVLAGLAVLAGYAGLRRRANALGEALSRAYEATHDAIAEGLGALRVIKSLEGEARAEAETMRALAAMRSTQLAFSRDRGLGQAALQLGGAAALAVLVWLAARRWGLDAATILPMVALFARALPLLGTLQEAWLNWRFARPALNATLALIERAEAAREPDAAAGPSPVPGRAITLHGIGVTIAGTQILADIALELPARGICALTGASGAGKSTLADLLGGLIAPDCGTMALDAHVLTPADRRAWRRRVAYVQQDPVLLSASVRENLAWGAPQADETAMRRALADAAAQFVDTLPRGLDTLIGDGGRVLSGGERQRLMLARALLREPALLILDEAASALDRASEAEIAAAVTRLGQRMAVLVIGHRGALLDLAARRFELEAGRLVATHGADQQP